MELIVVCSRLNVGAAILNALGGIGRKEVENV